MSCILVQKHQTMPLEADALPETYQIAKRNLIDSGTISINHVNDTIPLCADRLNNWNACHQVLPHPAPIHQLVNLSSSFVHKQSNLCENIDDTLSKRTNIISLKPHNIMKRKKCYNVNLTQRTKTSERPRKKNRNITFSNQVKVRRFYQKETNKNDLWYTDREMDDFKRSAKEVIYRARENNCSKDEYRGLEARISEKRSVYRSVAIKTILKFQDHISEKRRKLQQEVDNEENEMMHEENTLSNQYQVGTDDDLKLALVSQKCTLWARNIAFNTAKFDYHEAYGHCGNNSPSQISL